MNLDLLLHVDLLITTPTK